jgi:hypothetical protein
MNINWNEIVKKYPKSAKLFEQKYSDFKADCKYIPGLNLAFSISNSGIYQYDTALCPSREIGFDIFYILCEKFFDENNIIILLNYYDNIKRCEWTPQILNKDAIWLYRKHIYFNTRDEAKEQAVLKAFEIMENK